VEGTGREKRGAERREGRRRGGEGGEEALLVMWPTKLSAVNPPLALHLLGLRFHWCTYLLTYLHSWLGAYKTGNICETVEDKAKITINGLYKVVHGLSIAAKMYELE